MSSFRDAAFYRYHCHTKHTVAKLYSNQWYLDWDNQPNPFRHYVGADVVSLPPPRRPQRCDYFRLGEAAHGDPVTPQTVSQLLYYSMAISAWKEVRSTGARWSLRVNPSSGNLHPTETHLVCRDVEGLAAGCYHFRVDEFALERRSAGAIDDLLVLFQEHCGLPPRAVTVVLTSIFWREAWKYRDRAFRYCHHDVGHALGAIVECARGMGMVCSFRQVFEDDVVSGALGLGGGDERPCVLAAIGPAVGALLGTGRHCPEGSDTQGCDTQGSGTRVFIGTANELSVERIEYPSIDAVYEATRGRAEPQVVTGSRVSYDVPGIVPLEREMDSPRDFWEVVRTRRSGVDFDGQTGMTAAAFGAVMWRATRGADGDLFYKADERNEACFIHLYVYLHRVEGIEPGLYYYDRVRHVLVPLRLADQRREAAYLSLQQLIAGHSAFAVSMIADFAAAYRCFGERAYRAVHVEAGFIGQGLYLGAESAGVQATGIGAFFDDEVNQYLHLPEGFEVIYHFTVGGAVLDPRLQTARAYPFEE